MKTEYRQKDRQTENEHHYRTHLDQYIASSNLKGGALLEHFPKYIPRQSLSRYLALYDIFKKMTGIHGDIIQCGVNWGGSLMAFAQFSAIMEPYNLQRSIIGFDTFSGFVDIQDEDRANTSHEHSEKTPGGYCADSLEDLKEAIALFDQNRPLGHINKVQLIQGDACDTIPQFIKDNPHTVVALLHLDFDLYKPTKTALEHFAKRMPKGGVIIFDELGHRSWPGETVAVLETLGIHHLKIERFPFEPFISYAIVS